MSSSSSQTRSLTRSDELWHSLWRHEACDLKKKKKTSVWSLWLIQHQCHFHLNKIDLQAELFLPDRVQVAIDGLCPLLGLSHLDGDVGVTGTCSVLGLEALRTHD